MPAVLLQDNFPFLGSWAHGDLAASRISRPWNGRNGLFRRRRIRHLGRP
jgi:hypothetical protein